MNIFSVSDNPQICAEWLDDKRLNKMILESAQLLSTAVRMSPAYVETNYIIHPCKKAYVNHPCAVFTRANNQNYLYVLSLFIAYIQEYKHRFDKWHGCAYLIPFFQDAFPLIKGTLNYEHPKLYHPNVGRHLPLHLGYQLTLQEKWKVDKRPPRWSKRVCPVNNI